MENYLYFFLNIASLSVPFAFSFYPKAPFYKEWKYVVLSTTFTALVFIVWDAIFTDMGVWGFNPRYLSGFSIFGLPIEEMLFFFCIPYACIFTYYSLNYLIQRDVLFPHQELISSALIFFLLLAGIYHLDKWYTGVTFLSTGAFLAFQMLVLKPRYMGRFYVAYAVILIPFFLVNGVLTGSFIDEQVVWYNNEENLGLRMGTIPVEDSVYGFLMLVMNVSIYEWLKQRNSPYSF